VRLVGPPGARALAERLMAAHAPGVKALGEAEARSDAPPRFETAEIEDGWKTEIEGIEIRAASQPGGPLPAFAYRFDAGTRSVVVSSVGWGQDALVALAKGAEVLVVEALHRASIDAALEAEVGDKTRLQREVALHLATEDVGALAQRAGVHTVVLVRLRPPPLFAFQYTQIVGKTFSGRALVAADGDEITR
jgi:ribonuclease BN (tRNA processing enzyme)